MKETSVDIGKTYALRSLTGGEVQNANGDVIKTLDAGKQQHETAQESVWLVPDDCQVTKANFKRAALALGLLGGGDNSGLPSGYRRVEYLENTSTARIFTGITDLAAVAWYDCQLHDVGTRQTMGFNNSSLKWGSVNGYYRCGQTQTTAPAGDRDEVVFFIEVGTKVVPVLRVKGQEFKGGGDTSLNGEWTLWSDPFNSSYVKGKIWGHSLSINGKLVLNFIPALDQTGTPCMYDLISKQPFYNNGTGDFLYPGKEATATTYSLRRPRMYAQMTPRGIRRLYHVPKGYNGTPEEYAEQNGFKILVETPAPEEGYWAPVWHNREDCIELEWVETEPPAEELLT